MFQAWKRLWMERHNRLWVLPAFNSVIAVVLALAAAWVPGMLPNMKLPTVDAKTLDGLLSVIASSMLAVTTFSLSIMVSAFASASNGVTPRATELVMGDEGTRAAIANFLSAFMFSIVAQVALGMRYYSDNGRFILFVGTCVVLGWLMLTLLRWVKTLSSLGRLNNTLKRVEGAAQQAMTEFWTDPFMRADAGPEDTQALTRAPGSVTVFADDVQVIRRIDMAHLQSIAEKYDCRIHVRARAGGLVSIGTPLAVMVPDRAEFKSSDDETAGVDQLIAAVRNGIQLDRERTFDQDPRFGLIVLREAAQRALSPAVNDPGTAISCLNGMVRVLLKGQEQAEAYRASRADNAPEAHYDRLTVVPIAISDFLSDGFDPVARDGAGSFEVMMRMQKLLALIASSSLNRELAGSCRRHARFAHDCAMRTLVQDQDREAVAALHRKLFA